MPNTIAHLAINGLFTRIVISRADFKWIYLGCVIPDLPWILQRIVKVLPFSVDLYDLRAFCIVQSSLLLCVFISIAFAMLAKQRSKVFIILILGCLLHLLLDAVQIKWANGVQLLAPLYWDLIRFDFFWPESMGTYALVLAGLIYFVSNIKKSIQPNCEEFTISKKSISLSCALFLAWLVFPFAFIQSVYTEDNHFISTLKNAETRAGKQIEIDRNKIFYDTGRYKLRTAYGEIIKLENIDIYTNRDTLISIQGKFIDNETILVNNYHIHTKFRNYASMIGLASVLVIWLIFISRCCAIRFNRR